MVSKNSNAAAKSGPRRDTPDKMVADALETRADIHELRAFLESYLAVEDPAVREEIRAAVNQAADDAS